MNDSTVMVVDDHEGIRTMLRICLQNWGFQVIEAFDGKDGLNQLRQSRVDLVLLDYSMPDMDGLVMLSNLRQIHPKLPVVMLTADHSQSLAVQCFRTGADDFIVKPFDPDYLELVIRRTLRERHNQERLRKIQISLESERASSALKKILLARLGHELKTPLHHLLSHLDALAQALLPGGGIHPVHDAGAGRPPGEATPPWQQWLNKSLESSRQLDQLVDRLNRVALLEAGEMPFHPSTVKLRDLLHRALSGCSRKAEARRVRLIFVGDENLTIQADGERLLEAVTELLDNAIQFSPSDKEVTIQVSHGLMGAEVMIADHGPGVPDAEKKNVFAPFSMGAHTIDGRRGWGLGLTIAAHIVEAHGGSLTLSDPPEGAPGTWVRMILPFHANVWIERKGCRFGNGEFMEAQAISGISTDRGE